jgi:hypothetical protein
MMFSIRITKAEPAFGRHMHRQVRARLGHLRGLIAPRPRAQMTRTEPATAWFMALADVAASKRLAG